MIKLLNLSDGSLIDAPTDDVLDLAHDQDIMTDAPALDGVAVVRLVFPKFKDGRAFSQARVLRTRYGFKGEIRASGDLLPDQAAYARRVGIDTVEDVNDGRLDDFRFALSAYRFVYQPAEEGTPAHRLRGDVL
ncbi:MAG: DUF934 domain-containing protein [Pseudomonadota bacterium]